MDKIKNAVRQLMDKDNSGHGVEHVERVWKIAMLLAENEPVNKEVVAMAALLHDADDYKLVGVENADKLLNAKRIMREAGVLANLQDEVCEIITHMGYSKLLAGVRPQTLEGKIVSDADMLDAMGVNGIIRTLQYAFVRYQKYGLPLFDRKLFPELNLSAEEYKNKMGNCINHFFEKTLLLKDLMLTEIGRQKAKIRHQRMVVFLEGYFDENDLPEWQDYLQNYLLEQEKNS